MNVDVSSLIERLYASLLEPDRLPDALNAFTHLFHGDHAFLTGSDARAKTGSFAAAFGVSPSDLSRFMSAEALGLAQPVLAKVPNGVPVAITALYGTAGWERQPFYNEIVRPMNGFYSLSFHQPDTVTPFQIIVCRGRDEGDYTPDEHRLLARIVPHIRTTLEIARRLSGSAGAVSSLQQLICAMDHPVIITNAAGAARLMNAEAEEMIDAGLGLSLRGTLAATTREETTRLLALIASVASDPSGATGSFVVQGRHGPLLLRLTRMPLPSLPFGWAAGTHVAIFVKHLDRPRRVPATTLAQIYGLTPREAEIASHLSCGMSPTAISDHLSIGLGTARFHLKNIFLKTDTRSQAALVARLQTVAF